ncbi:hypothetical protein [Photobacterium halotolerans]|uniref:hypothetical protein n=1 Tax=Photobacterium halotolerans TaxID=265726 RepID=UPI000415E0EC|nr:hypothetical protein [Photobacterium halotolerans]
MTTTVSLPEYTEEYKQQQHQQVLEADVVHEWEWYSFFCQLFPFDATTTIRSNDSGLVGLC